MKKVAYTSSGGASAAYGLGVIGSLIYFIQHAANIQEGLMGVLMSLVWPAILTYKAFELLGY